MFCRGGKILHEGDIIKMPKLANTYETIASEGADAFYTGSLAKQIIDDIRSVGEKQDVCPNSISDLTAAAQHLGRSW